MLIETFVNEILNKGVRFMKMKRSPSLPAREQKSVVFVKKQERLEHS